MAKVEAKLEELGLKLPEYRAPNLPFHSVYRVGNLLFISGTVSMDLEGKILAGKLGADVTVEEGYERARLLMLRILGNVKHEIGDLDKVKRAARIFNMINSTPDFTQHPRVANGASELLIELYGDDIKGTRSAVGMASLPGNATVEIEGVFEIAD